jgi:hypothetical protein
VESRLTGNGAQSVSRRNGVSETLQTRQSAPISIGWITKEGKQTDNNVTK